MTAGSRTDAFILQALVHPEPGISTATALYYRMVGEGSPLPEGAGFDLGPEARLTFDTYFNAFDAGEWVAACGLETLAFRLEGEGRVRLSIIRSDPRGGFAGRRVDETLAEEVDVILAPGAPCQVDLSAHLPEGARVLHAEIVASEEGARITSGQFVTHDTPKAWPRLAISVTTFRREEAVQATARRLAAFLAGFEHGDHVWMQVVDNGKSAEIVSGDHVRVFPNENLGGAGGFARGLIEARAAGATHCLFMDDDASFHVENIRRTYAFLALARDPATALAGAMITNTRKYEMFENGAIFDGVCRPQHQETDLRDREDTYRMLFRATQPLPDNAYGGWWYFAFPIQHARHLPFPFFVRGDDSGFSLANRFHIRTLNGVVSFQDSFGEKENPLIHYLDARYHLLHHIVFPDLDRGALRNAFVPLRLVLRSIARFHYEAAEAQLMAMRDVMQGPDFFLENADMARRREDLKALTKTETWRDLDVRPTRIRRHNKVIDKLWALTLNGLFLPFFGRWGARRVVRLSMRGPLWPMLGAREVTFVGRATGKGYTVAFDRRRGFALLREALREARRLQRSHASLVAAYRGRYDEITSEATWKRLLGLTRSD